MYKGPVRLEYESRHIPSSHVSVGESDATLQLTVRTESGLLAPLRSQTSILAISLSPKRSGRALIWEPSSTSYVSLKNTNLSLQAYRNALLT